RSPMDVGTTVILVALVNARERLVGKMRMSVDTLSEREVREGLEDCSLEIDVIYTYEFDFTRISVDDIVDFHFRMLSEGKADICLTCVEAVHKALLRNNYPRTGFPRGVKQSETQSSA
ncbi:MAG TPA: hypothetical protein PLD93_06115, partial [Synergistaceae bacterium]|nr:hypothetical protein [Synergistaceae bacterium]